MLSAQNKAVYKEVFHDSYSKYILLSTIEDV